MLTLIINQEQLLSALVAATRPDCLRVNDLCVIVNTITGETRIEHDPDFFVGSHLKQHETYTNVEDLLGEGDFWDAGNNQIVTVAKEAAARERLSWALVENIELEIKSERNLWEGQSLTAQIQYV